MGNKRSKLMNQKVVANKINNIITKKKNKFGFILTADVESTKDCEMQMRSGQLYDPKSNENIDISCKGEARSAAIMLIRYFTILVFILIVGLYTTYIVKQKNVDNGKKIYSYIVQSIIIVMVLIHFVAVGLNNLHSDTIVYYFWETRKERKNKSGKDNIGDILDKFNLQSCKGFDKNKCKNERFNKLISLENTKSIDDLKSNKSLEKFLKKWEPVKDPTPLSVDGRDVNIFTFIEKPDNTKQKLKVLETPFLLIGTQCEYDPVKKCFSGTTSLVDDASQNLGIDSMHFREVDNPFLEGKGQTPPTPTQLSKQLLSPEDGPIKKLLEDVEKVSQLKTYTESPSPTTDNLPDNIKNYRLLSKTPCRARGDEQFCKSTKKVVEGKESDIDECKWSAEDKSCSKNWIPGEGHELWTCDLCDDISTKCSLSWRTWATYILCLCLSAVFFVLGISSQFVFKEDDETKLTNGIRSTMTITSYIMTYYMVFAYLIFNTLHKMCPDGSDMGIIGRGDLQSYYNSLGIITNPFKIGELFNFWRKEYISNVVILSITAISLLILLSFEFNFFKLLGGASGTSLALGGVYSLVYSLVSFGRPNIDSFVMALYMGWGVGLMFGSLWSLYTDKIELKNPGLNLGLGTLIGGVVGFVSGYLITFRNFSPFPNANHIFTTILGIVFGILISFIIGLNETEEN